MQRETHIRLNDVTIEKLLAVVLSLQIALWALIALGALGVSVPIIQPLIGFVYLTFVPGILLLAALRLRNLGIVETILYSVGLSVTVVMSIGLVLTVVINATDVIKPFSLLAVTSSVSFVVLLLCAIVYFRNRTQPLFAREVSAPLAPTLFLCILPFLAVFSTHLVNAYDRNAAQLLLWLIVGIVVILIAFDKIIHSKLYPLAVYVIAVTLLLQYTLISAWLTGADIITEWGLARLVLNSGVWNPNLLNPYNGMLSVVALAPIYSLISSLDLVWVFKLVYPVIFALVPIGLYQVFRKQLNDKVAFLSCFFFMSFAPFYVQLTALARQEVAELFFALLILLLVSKEMDQRTKSALFIVFGISMVVSHYGLSYIVIFLLFLMWVVSIVTRAGGSKLGVRYNYAKPEIDEDKQTSAPSPESPAKGLVTIAVVSVLFIASTAWYFFTAQATVTVQFVSLVHHILGSIRELLNPTYSQAVSVVQKGPSSGILHRINAYVNYLNMFLIFIGLCVTVFLKKQRFKLQFSYVLLSTVALGFLIASIAVPWLGAGLDWERVLHITLFVLAPFLVIGFITIGETAGVTMRNITRKLGFGNSAPVSLSRLTRLLAIYLVFFLLLSTGFLFALTEGYQNIALSSQVDGLYSHQTIVGATWQVNNIGALPLSGKPVTIFHYLNGIRYNDSTQLTNSDGQITFTQAFDSAGPIGCYATFDGDLSYEQSTSAAVNLVVGQGGGFGSQATASLIRPYPLSDNGTITTLSASTTSPAVGQPVTFTATLTSEQVVYGDVYNQQLLASLELGGKSQTPFYPRNATIEGSNMFLGSYNIEQNKALLNRFVGVNPQLSYVNATSLISNRSLIYSNGGASLYS